MKSKYLTIITILLFTTLLPAHALTMYDENVEAVEEERCRLDVLGGINTDGYEAEIGFTWYLVPTFGLRLSVGIASEWEETSFFDDYYYDNYGYYDTYSPYYNDYYYDYNDYYYDSDYTVRFKLMPSLMLRSPALIKWDDCESSVHLFANPGICLSPGASGSHGADWFSWQLRGGIETVISDIVVIGLGYGYSNFNLYSGNPYSHYEAPDEPKRHIHTGYISLGVKF